MTLDLLGVAAALVGPALMMLGLLAVLAMIVVGLSETSS